MCARKIDETTRCCLLLFQNRRRRERKRKRIMVRKRCKRMMMMRIGTSKNQRLLALTLPLGSFQNMELSFDAINIIVTAPLPGDRSSPTRR